MYTTSKQCAQQKPLKKLHGRHIDNIFFFLIFHANCLRRRHFALNVKTYFLKKKFLKKKTTKKQKKTYSEYFKMSSAEMYTHHTKRLGTLKML